MKPEYSILISMVILSGLRKNAIFLIGFFGKHLQNGIEAEPITMYLLNMLHVNDKLSFVSNQYFFIIIAIGNVLVNIFHLWRCSHLSFLQTQYDVDGFTLNRPWMIRKLRMLINLWLHGTRKYALRDRQTCGHFEKKPPIERATENERIVYY